MLQADSLKRLYEERRNLIFETAQKYVEEGDLHVVVVHSALCDNRIKRGKAPTHGEWQKQKLSWLQLQQEMLRVWNREGGCNIGLKTGKTSGIICVDVDVKGGGLSWFYEHKDHLGSPIVERTGGEGLHLYYCYPTNSAGELKTRSSGKRIFPGVDILADGAGQVVTHPSIHASHHTPYIFDNGLDLLDVRHEADQLPQWIVDEMMASIERDVERQEQKQQGAFGEGAPADAWDLVAAKVALSSIAGAQEGSGGDLQTLRAAMACKDYGLNASQVYDLLLKEYNPRCAPPWSPAELRQKVKNAFRYGQRSIGVSSISQAFSAMNSVEIDEVIEAASPNTSLAYSKKNAIHSAKVFVARNQKVISCYDQQLVYYEEDTHKWKVARDTDFENLIYKDIAKFCNNGELLRTMKVSFLADVRKAVRMEINIPRPLPDNHWKNGKHIGVDFITVNNGILDVRSGTLLPHDPDWFCFSTVDIDFEPDASCSLFKNFLAEIWDGDQKLVESLRLWIGYCLLTAASAQRFAVFKGASRAGKSTLVSLIENLVGYSNAASTSLSLIGSDFGLESLLGKKLVVFQDADKASADRMGVATERIKSLASNDPMGINRKGQTVVFQKLNAKVNFVCNKMPPFLNDENALTNRMIVFPFWKSYQGKEDLELPAKLKSELSGIFNWALVGAQALVEGRARLFTAPRGEETLEELAQQFDSVQGFWVECVELTDGAHNTVTPQQLWDAYRHWCRESGRSAKNRQRFLTELAARPALQERRDRSSAHRGYRGVRVRAMEEVGPLDDDIPF